MNLNKYAHTLSQRSKSLHNKEQTVLSWYLGKLDECLTLGGFPNYCKTTDIPSSRLLFIHPVVVGWMVDININSTFMNPFIKPNVYFGNKDKGQKESVNV